MVSSTSQRTRAAVIEIMSRRVGITDPVAANDGYKNYVRRTDKTE
jgi:hypothetical protein